MELRWHPQPTSGSMWDHTVEGVSRIDNSFINDVMVFFFYLIAYKRPQDPEQERELRFNVHACTHVDKSV